MNLTIKINCDNEAFGSSYDDAAREAGRLLVIYGKGIIDGGIACPSRWQAESLRADFPTPLPILDENGNSCGSLKWTGVTRKWLEQREIKP
jgi:hypothetical protein